MKLRMALACALIFGVLTPAPSSADTATIGVAYDLGGRGDKSFNDATAAGFHAGRFNRAQGLFSVFVSVRLADFRIIALRALEVVVEAIHARGGQALGLPFAEQAQRGADLDGHLSFNTLNRFANGVELCLGGAARGRHDTVFDSVLGIGCARAREEFVHGLHLVVRHAAVGAGGLAAERAVFSTDAAFGILQNM